MSMVGVEVTKFINPNLTWKTASKGSRSASRRPRKLEIRNLDMGVDQANNSFRAEETSTSECEKLGAAVLGHRFYDKVEHVPIKKRKYLFRSPSPSPLTPSPFREHSEELINSNKSPSSTSVSNKLSAKFSDCAGDGGVNGNISEEKPACNGDFSGIEMLVAVACNDSIAVVGSAKEAFSDGEEIESSSSTLLSKLNVVMTKNSVAEDDLNCSELRLFNFSASSTDKTPVNSDSMHIDRSHWDLNTVMDAWEEPGANLNGDRQADTVATLPRNDTGFKDQVKRENFETTKTSKDFAESTVLSLTQNGVPSYGHGCMPALPINGDLSLDMCLLKFKDESNFVSVTERVSETPLKPSDLPCSDPVGSTNVCLGFPINSLKITMPKDTCNSTPPHDPVKSSNSVPGLNLGQSKLNTDDTLTPVSEKTTLTGIRTDEIEGSGYTSRIRETISPMSSTEKFQSPDYDSLKSENRAIKSSVTTDFHSSSEFLDLSGQGNNALQADSSGDLDSPTPFDHKDISGKSTTLGDGPGFSLRGLRTSCNNNVPSDRSKKLCGSQGLQDGQKNHLVGMEKLSEVQEGYDSQFEDGELRESLVQCLKDIEGDDGEAEQLDYESDDRDMYDIADDVDCSFSFETCMRETSPTTTLNVESMKKNPAKCSKVPLIDTSKRNNLDLEMDREIRRRPMDGTEPCSTADAPKEDPGLDNEKSNSKWSGWDSYPGDCLDTKKAIDKSYLDGYSAAVAPPLDAEVMEGRIVGSADAPVVKNISGTRVVDLRGSRRVTTPCNQEKGSSFNLLARNRSVHVQLRRSAERGEFCGERERVAYGSGRGMGGRGRYCSSHTRGRGGRVGHRSDDRSRPGNAMWNSRPHDNNFRSYSNPDSSAYDSRKQRLNCDSKIEDGMYYSKGGGGVYRPFVRRRSPAKMHHDDYESSGSGRYVQKDGHLRQLPSRGSVEQQPQVPFSRNLSQRERNFSPMFSRGDAPRYRYRSRSRSPHSPPEFRVNRGPPPLRKPDYESDYEAAEFMMSPPQPRRRFSPKHDGSGNSRWMQERKRDDFRNRRSPVAGGRIFNRFDRVKPGDDCYNRASMIHGGRFGNIGYGGGRGDPSVSGSGGCDEMRRRAGRYPQHFMRRCGSGSGADGLRRFQYDNNNEGGFAGEEDEQQHDHNDNGKEGGFSEW